MMSKPHIRGGLSYRQHSSETAAVTSIMSMAYNPKGEKGTRLPQISDERRPYKDSRHFLDQRPKNG